MLNIVISFIILEDDEPPPSSYNKASGYIIFDVKMDFTRKAWWVKYGHQTPDPESLSYAGVLSRESIWILLAHSAMHAFPVTVANLLNAYLQAPTSEKHYIICGPDFGLENVGKNALIKRALYG